MQALFVHGMGRSPLSGWPMLRQLRAAGWQTAHFGYMASLQSFDAIAQRLSRRIASTAAQGAYVLIGHSLGGVLIRAALARLPEGTARPKHIFLLASPSHPARLAQKLGNNPVFRLLTQDCGQLLGSAQRMGSIPMPDANAPVTAIVGTKGFSGRFSPFGVEVNDGIVSLSEVSSCLATEQIRLHLSHTFLPASAEVARIILRCTEAKQNA